MQHIDVKSNKSLSKSHDFQRELCLCNFHIINWLLYDPRGGAFASLQCPHPGEFANFIEKNANAQGLAHGGGGMGTGGID